MAAGPDVSFWQERFRSGQTAWDRGGCSPALVHWLQSGEFQPCRILVPGCGQGWEVLALAQAGFEVTGIDYASQALEKAQALLARHGAKAQLVQADVLAFQPPTPVDMVYEQTCLCALYPDHWRAYADQLHRWLTPRGHLLGTFMQAPRPEAQEGFVQGPPYDVNIHAVRALFPETRWAWPKPPYARIPHPALSAAGWFELALVLRRNPEGGTDHAPF